MSSLVLFLLSGAAGPLSAIVAPDVDPPQKAIIQIHAVHAPADPADDEDDAGGTNMIVRKLDPNDMAPNGGQVKGFFSTQAAPVDLPAGGPWLGVMFGPVAKPIASQLKLKADSGQMILNVYEGSAADQAGLQQYDVLTQIDGQDVSGNLQKFLEVVRGFSPNQTHVFSVVRAGQNVQVSVVVGTRPAAADLANGKLKYQNEGEELSGSVIRQHSGMLQKDPSGNWVFQNLNLKGMPNVWSIMPDGKDLNLDFNFAMPSGPGTGSARVFVKSENGNTLRIEQSTDGKITVSRTEKVNGQDTTTSKIYANEDELQSGDADAYKIIKASPKTDMDVLLKLQTDGLPNQDAMKKLHDQFMGQGGLGGTTGKGGFMMLHGGGKARTSFETLADGKIRVTTRQGDGELVENYDNAAALQAAKPELFKKYEKLHSSQTAD